MSLLTRRSAQCEDGFGLIEVIVSLGIAAVVLTSLAYGLVAGVRTSLVARTTQLASDVLSKEIESVRAMEYTAVVSRSGSLGTTAGVTGPNASPCSDGGSFTVVDAPATNYCYQRRNGTTEAVAYDIASASSGLTTAYTVKPDGRTPYAVTRVVTQPFDSQGTYRRLVFSATWTTAGKTRTKYAETFIVDTRRGLPLPRFTVKQYGTPTPTPKTQSVGSAVDFAFFVDNLGARDAFDVTASDGKPWAYHVDASPYDGVYQSGEPLAADFNGNTKADTGEMEPDAIIRIVATRTVQSGEAATQTTTFSLRSIAQPTAPPVTTAAYVLNVPSGVAVSASPSPTGTASPSPSPSPSSCASATSAPAPVGTISPATTPTGSAGSQNTLYTYSLHNVAGGATADSATQQGMPLTSTAADASCLYNFSTDASGSGVGRYLAPGGALSGTTAGPTAVWFRQVSSSGTAMDGTAVLTIYVQCAASCSSVTLTAALGQQSGSTVASTFTSWGQSSVTVTNGPTQGFQPISFSLPTTAKQSGLGTSDYVAVRLVSSAAVRIAYDSTSYPATVTLPADKQL